MSTALYEVRSGDSRLPVKLVRRGLHLYLVEVIGQDAKTWVRPDELVAVASPTVAVGGAS